jgi:hypothetical protein
MQTTKRIPYYACLALLAYMPFHIFLTQSLSLLTGGLEIWKVAKDVLLILVTLFAVCLVLGMGRVPKQYKWLLGISAAYAAMHAVLWMAHPDIYKQSAELGMLYNLRLPEFAILGYSAVILKPDLFKSRTLITLILGVSGVVALLGVIQYFLPSDILTHVGYSIERGVRPNFFIDNKAGFPRIMSTLREPNALGAYLIIPMALTVLVWAKVKERKHKIVLIALFALYGLALLWTFSRSAWIGAVIAVILVLTWNYRAALLRFVQRFWFVCLIAVLGLGAVAYTQRNTSFVKGYISHTSNDKDIDSNQYHYLFVKQGIEGIIDQPLGHGPGTAGLASIQNPKGSFLTENYYVQIGYEVGVVGLLLFVALNALIYVGLWRTRHTALGAMLLATFWSYVLTNMLLHTWSNEAVACQWWLLAGLVLGVQATHASQRAKTKKS